MQGHGLTCTAIKQNVTIRPKGHETCTPWVLPPPSNSLHPMKGYTQPYYNYYPAITEGGSTQCTPDGPFIMIQRFVAWVKALLGLLFCGVLVKKRVLGGSWTISNQLPITGFAIMLR